MNKRICLNKSVLDFMESKLTPESFVLEYGSGWSTRWFAERCRKLISIETNAEWTFKVFNDIGASEHDLSHVQVRLSKNMARISEDIQPGSVDLILIDCLERMRFSATLTAWPLLRVGGWIIFDDAQRDQHFHSIEHLYEKGGEPIDLKWQPGDVESAKERLALAWEKSE